MGRSIQNAAIFLIIHHNLQFVCAGEVLLGQFPVYTQASNIVGQCVERWSSVLSTSYGCPSQAAACLCTDPLKSTRGVSAIRSCLAPYDTSNVYTGTELWRSYCSVNAGVSALDETLVEDLPLFTRVSAVVSRCVASETGEYAKTLGCNDYTRAQCLCGATDNYNSVQTAINSCVYYNSQQPSASALWSSFCNVNLQTPAQRVVGNPPLTITGINNPTGSNSARTSAATAGAGSKTAATATSTATSGGGGSGQSNTSSSNSISPTAIASIVSGIGFILCFLAIWAFLRYRRNPARAQPTWITNTSGPHQSESSWSSAPSQAPLTSANLSSHGGSVVGTAIGPNESASVVGGRTNIDEHRFSMPAQPAPSVLSSGLGGSTFLGRSRDHHRRT